MSVTRNALANAIRSKLKAATSQERYIADMQISLADHGARARIFDDLPCIISKDKMQDYTQVLKSLFLYVLPKEDRDGKWEIGSREQTNKIIKMLQDITELSFKELLDSRGRIRKEITALLDWPENLNQIYTFDILLAYVGKVLQDVITENAQDFISPEKKNTANAIIGCINANSFMTTFSTLKQKNLIFDKSSLNEYIKVASGPLLPISHEKAVIGVGIAAAVTISLAMAAKYLFFGAAKVANTAANNGITPDKVMHKRL